MAEPGGDHEADLDTFLDKFRGPQRYEGGFSPENWEKVGFVRERRSGGAHVVRRLGGAAGGPPLVTASEGSRRDGGSCDDVGSGGRSAVHGMLWAREMPGQTGVTSKAGGHGQVQQGLLRTRAAAGQRRM